jgi:hypothetical protein
MKRSNRPDLHHKAKSPHGHCLPDRLPCPRAAQYESLIGADAIRIHQPTEKIVDYFSTTSAFFS